MGGPDMAPIPPYARHAPAEPGRSSSTRALLTASARADVGRRRIEAEAGLGNRREQLREARRDGDVSERAHAAGAVGPYRHQERATSIRHLLEGLGHSPV